MRRLAARRALPLLLATLLPAALAAQQVDSSVVRPGTLVRVLVRDTSMMVIKPRRLGMPGLLEGTFVTQTGRDAVLRLGRGYTYTIPFDNMRGAQQRVDRGPCRRGRAARVACLTSGVALGAGIGWLGGRKIGATVAGAGYDERQDARRTYGLRGLLLGTALAAWVTPAWGRDEWADVPQWVQGSEAR